MRLGTKCIVILALAVRESDQICHKMSDTRGPRQNECTIRKHIQSIKGMSYYTKRPELWSGRAP